MLIQVVLALLAAQCAFALDPSLAISQYAKRHWQVEDGLPQNYVTSIAQSAEGYLVVGTAGGVARFDGLRFTPVVLDAKTGLTREWITAVACAGDGSIRIASRDAGSYLYRNGTVVRHWPVRFDSLLTAADGSVYALGDGLTRWSADSVQQLERGFRSSDPSWQGLASLADGAIIAATTAGLKRLGSKPVAAPGRALAVAPARDGSFWLGTSEGLYKAAGARMEPVGPVRGPVVNVIEDRDGAVWAATWGHGLYRITPQAVDRWTSSDGLADDFVHNVFEDSEGSLWIGSRAGLSRWKSTPIVPFGVPEGLHGQFVSAITGDDAGNVYLGTWRSGLYRFSSGRLSSVRLPEPEFNVLIRAMAVAPGGMLWASDWTRLHEKTGSRWQRHFDRTAGPAPDVFAILADSRGGLWLGTSDGVYHYPGGRPDASAPILRTAPVRAMMMDRSGRLWIGAADGLRVLESGRARQVPGLPHPAVIAIAEDTQGRVWATSRGNGICVLAASGAQCFDSRHGLPALPVYALLDDRQGSLWMSSPAGIYSVPSSQLTELIEGKRTSVEAVAFGQEDGMRSIECQNVGHPSAWRDPAGALWFATVRGVVRIQPGMRRSSKPPDVVVENVEAGSGSHLVRFTAPRLASPERVEFRYRIEGLSTDWISAGAERTLRYNYLPAGQHHLLISARERGGDWGPSTSVVLTQEPRLYETAWFRTACVLAAAGLIFAVYRWRMVLVRMRYRAVLAERNRIAEEWHDTLLAGFSAISWQLDATLQRLRDKPETAATAIETARTMLQHYRTEARHVIWDLRSQEPELESLAGILKNRVAEMTRDQNIACNVNVEGQPVTLPGDLAQNVLRICQEATANAVRHASPSRIDVRLRFGERQVVAAVADDGAGFEPDAVPVGHFGLEIMRERARRFGGTVEITSRRGGGTTVTAAIPYPL